MDNQLVRTPDSLPAMKTIETLSPGLRTLLRPGESDDDAVAAIAASPTLLDEALKAREGFVREALAPATAQDVMNVIGRRFATFPQPQRSPDEFKAFWTDYLDCLVGQPISSLEAGMRMWIAGGAEFLPKPGQLLNLAKGAPVAEARAARIIRLAGLLADESKAAVGRPQTAAERAALSAEIRAAVRVKRA